MNAFTTTSGISAFLREARPVGRRTLPQRAITSARDLFEFVKLIRASSRHLRMGEKEYSSVQNYYQDVLTAFGYLMYCHDIRHFGIRPEGVAGISELEAQLSLHRVMAEIGQFKIGEKALDAGCGGGKVALDMAKSFGLQVTGISITPTDIETATRRAKECGFDGRVNFVEMDYARISFPDNTFDVVYTTETLSHALDIDLALSELFRVCKPGGRVVFCEYEMQQDAAFTLRQRKIRDITLEEGSMPAMYQLRVGAFDRKMKARGFQAVKVMDVSTLMEQSYKRLFKVGCVTYPPVFCFGEMGQRRFVNITAAFENFLMARQGLYRYVIVSAKKPE